MKSIEVGNSLSPGEEIRSSHFMIILIKKWFRRVFRVEFPFWRNPIPCLSLDPWNQKQLGRVFRVEFPFLLNPIPCLSLDPWNQKLWP
jgi:hypothetical protein